MTSSLFLISRSDYYLYYIFYKDTTFLVNPTPNHLYTLKKSLFPSLFRSPFHSRVSRLTSRWRRDLSVAGLQPYQSRHPRLTGRYLRDYSVSSLETQWASANKSRSRLLSPKRRSYDELGQLDE